MPRKPIDRPEKTLVTMKATPWTVPTSPLALSRSSAGMSRVTVVERAMLRRLSMTAPARMMRTKTQKIGPVQSIRALSGKSHATMPASTNAPKVTMLETTMIGFLRCRSTRVPKYIPEMAMKSMKAPPMIAVAITERVSR